MSRKPPKWLLPAVLLFALVAIASWLILSPRGDGPAGGDSESADAPGGVGQSHMLYFPASGGLLKGETHNLPQEPDPVKRVGNIVTAVLAGPKGPGLFETLPEGVEVGRVLTTTDGTAFVDLISAEFASPPASGSRQELLSVYSLVNSVLMNETSLRRVVLLWNGQQRATLSGHVDLSRPLGLRRDFIAEAPAE